MVFTVWFFTQIKMDHLSADYWCHTTFSTTNAWWQCCVNYNDYGYDVVVGSHHHRGWFGGRRADQPAEMSPPRTECEIMPTSHPFNLFILSGLVCECECTLLCNYYALMGLKTNAHYVTMGSGLRVNDNYFGGPGRGRESVWERWVPFSDWAAIVCIGNRFEFCGNWVITSI